MENILVQDVFGVIISKLPHGYVFVMAHVCKKYKSILTDSNTYMAFNWGSIATLDFCKDGHTNLLSWYHETFGVVHLSSSLYSAEHGQLECLKWLNNNRYPLDKDCITQVGYSGNIECLEWLEKKGQLLSHGTYRAAASSGHINILALFVRRYEALPRDQKNAERYKSSLEFFLTAACNGGHISVIEWLLQKGARLNARHLAETIQRNHYLCLKWLINRGSWIFSIWHNAVQVKEVEVV